MSEFKFACPVCGQHMMCDSSQGGSVMECPTCFQRIIAPQAPAPDAKFILTGTKLTEKKITAKGLETPATPAAPENRLSTAVVLLVTALILIVGGLGVYFFKAQPARKQHDWRSTDVGGVRQPGAFSQKDGKFTVTGGGSDIWGDADAFHFVYLKALGDVEIEAEVLGLEQTDPWAKAGLMFRDSLKPESQFALAAATSSAGITYQARTSTSGQASVVSGSLGLTAPRWFRLKRQGNVFTAFSSPDGSQWSEMGSATITMSGQVFVGLAVCSHNENKLCQAQFRNVSLKGHTQTAPEVTNAPATKPVLVAPPASDANWMLTLPTNAIPDSPVAGRIHGRDFIVERAIYQNGTLTLRFGSRGPVDFGAMINFGSAPPESLSGKTINVTSDAVLAARVTLCWKGENAVMKATYTNGYALRLEFGPLANNKLPGKIYLCSPDAEKSYLLGSFRADARKPKPPQPK
jgi:regulation of enolase protein 1 (concanavalin A-like superfamily)